MHLQLVLQYIIASAIWAGLTKSPQNNDMSKKKTTYFETLSQTHACFTITVSTAQWTSLSK